ncbi:MAG: glucose 1-dehydrogenase [Tepidisphaera sp.]|nr:glucose 1-dehydrogenase [Tepidisphaera sp.]
MSDSRTPSGANDQWLGVFKGRTALVTGGTSGIGRATALALARAGANVVITGRRQKEGEQVASEIKARGVQGVFVQGDVTDEAHVRRAVETAEKITGKLHYAFNNAGVELAGVSTAESTIDQYRRVMDINVLGVLLSMKHEIPALVRAGHGAIVNNASIAGRIGMAGLGIYIASKHAVVGLTKSAALEVAKQGVRVNAVSPGGVHSEMLERFTNNDANALAWMESMHPVGRIGKPDEIANPVLFLLSDAASFITGHDLLVDGGFTVP